MITTLGSPAKALPNDLIDELLSGYKRPKDLIGENDLPKQATKALVKMRHATAIDVKKA